MCCFGRLCAIIAHGWLCRSISWQDVQFSTTSPYHVLSCFFHEAKNKLVMRPTTASKSVSLFQNTACLCYCSTLPNPTWCLNPLLPCCMFKIFIPRLCFPIELNCTSGMSYAMREGGNVHLSQLLTLKEVFTAQYWTKLQNLLQANLVQEVAEPSESKAALLHIFRKRIIQWYAEVTGV